MVIAITANDILNIAKARGKYFFQVRCISWSYRNRGYEARTHRNRKTRRIVFTANTPGAAIGILDTGLPPPKNIKALSAFINIMFLYSAIKKRANGPPAYSTLYPDTSSDSPSVRSNGARLVSASVDTNHMTVRGTRGINAQQPSCKVRMSVKEKDPTHSSIDSSISPKLISYEMV